MLLRARLVWPVSQPPLEDGAVLISNQRVAGLAPWRDWAGRHTGPVVDLGHAILLPGLVNAHCHLDYTHMSGLPPQKRFSDWIKSLLALKAAASYTDYAEAWLNGARMLARTGTTTVADIEAVPELLPDVWSSTPLRVASFLEMTGIHSGHQPEDILQQAAAKLTSLSPARGLVGLSPHALCSTPPALLRLTAEMARRRRWRLTMHLAESLDEYEMYRHRRGAMFDWLSKQRDMSDCGLGTPVEQAARCGLFGRNFLAVHANYLEPADIAALAQSRASVVHCPRSHAYFGHQPFPYRALAEAGLNICLGTDSLASVKTTRGRKTELNMFAEMRAFAATQPDLPPAEIIRMATQAGARALGWQGRVGAIFPHALADLIALPFTGPAEDAADAVVHHAGPLLAAMIDGQWIHQPPSST
jgi:aminodeoxyfutalosine deaminase